MIKMSKTSCFMAGSLYARVHEAFYSLRRSQQLQQRWDNNGSRSGCSATSYTRKALWHTHTHSHTHIYKLKHTLVAVVGCIPNRLTYWNNLTALVYMYKCMCVCVCTHSAFRALLTPFSMLRQIVRTIDIQLCVVVACYQHCCNSF